MSSYSCVRRKRHLDEVLQELVIQRVTSTVQRMHVQPTGIVHLGTLQEHNTRVLFLLRPDAIRTDNRKR